MLPVVKTDIDFGKQYQHRININKAMALGKELTQVIEDCNRAIDASTARYANRSRVQQILEALRETSLAIKLESKGIPVESVEESERSNLYGPVHNQMCVRLWRIIVKKLHPDYGGDPEHFMIAHNAYKAKDLETLRYYSQQFDMSTATQITVEEWEASQIKVQRIQSQIDMVKSSQLYRILRLRVANAPDHIQVEALTEYLVNRLRQMTIELMQVRASQTN